MKKCSKCKEVKELIEFGVNNTSKDGLKFSCRACRQIAKYKFTRLPNGVTGDIYAKQRASSRRRKHPEPAYSLQEFREWMYSQPNWLTLYNAWVESGYKQKLRPSADRNSNYLPYTFDNLTLMTWLENKTKNDTDRRDGFDTRAYTPVIGTCLKTGRKIRFESMKEAELNGFGKILIWMCIKGRNRYHKGHTWRYA